MTYNPDTEWRWQMGCGSGIVLFLLLFVVLLMWGCPQYNVWQQGLSGQAEFKKAEQNRRIVVEAARAKMDAAKFEAQAESIRSIGIANANRIVASSITEPYLRYLFIDKLGSDTAGLQVIYVPTEANLPILEAGKRP